MSTQFYVANRTEAGCLGFDEFTDEDDPRWMNWNYSGMFDAGNVTFYRALKFCSPILNLTPMPAFDASTWPQVRATTSPTRGCVPQFKFDHSWDWHFTIEECRILAYHLANAPEERSRDLGRFFAWASNFGGAYIG